MKKTIRFTFSVLILVAPIVLLCLPADFFDHGKAICLSKTLLNMECLGCGITRAIQHLIHFDFNEAWMFNKLSFVVLPVLAFIWGREALKAYKLIKK